MKLDSKSFILVFLDQRPASGLVNLYGVKEERCNGPLITLNIPSISFEFEVDKFVQKIDVNIRIKRVIISFCEGEGNIFRIFRVLKK